MDCAPTLDVVDGVVEDEEEEVGEDRTNIWGRLFPLGKGFVAQGKANTTRMIMMCSYLILFMCRFCEG